MPTAFRFRGYRFFFFSNEGHEPPHTHIESGGNYAKFWLEPVELSGSVGYNSAELTRLRHLVERHRGLLLEKWHEYFS